MSMQSSIKYLIVSILLFFYLDTFAQKPPTPLVDSVSVENPASSVVISWQVDDISKVDGFRIYRKIFGFGHNGVIDGANMPIIDIPNRNATFFRDTTSQYGKAAPQKTSEYYYIASYKKIDENNIVYSVMSIQQNTLKISKIDYDFCSENNSIRWNSYRGWQDYNYDSLLLYKVYAKNPETGIYTEIGTVNAPDTAFIHQNVKRNQHYTYFVRAFHQDLKKTAASVTDTIFTKTPTLPQNVSVVKVNVGDDNVIEISGLLDAQAEVLNYYLMRSNAKNPQPIAIATFNTGIADFEFVDTQASSLETNYYHIEVKDICQRIDLKSPKNYHLVLMGERQSNSINQLTWQDFSLQTVAQYRLGLIVQDGSFQLLSDQNLPPFTHNTEQLTSDELNLLANKGSLCYRLEFDINTTSGTQTLHSNTLCFPMSMKVYIPTAINPVSETDENRYFKPKIDYATNYVLVIYNRNGNPIFESNDVATGWNGRINGNAVPQGTYIFYVKFNDADNVEFEKFGYFSVIYP